MSRRKLSRRTRLARFRATAPPTLAISTWGCARPLHPPVVRFYAHDHHGFAKAMWFLFIVFVPIIGVFSYLVTRPAMVVDEVIVTE